MRHEDIKVDCYYWYKGWIGVPPKIKGSRTIVQVVEENSILFVYGIGSECWSFLEDIDLNLLQGPIMGAL